MLKNKFRFRWLYIVVVAVLLASVGIGVGITGNTDVSVDSEGLISFESRVALATSAGTMGDGNPRYTGIALVEETPWGYLYTLENGDIVEVGDSTTTDFKAHVKTIRWNGVADFSLWREGGTFTPTLTDTTVSFDFNDEIHIDIYPSPPCPRIPEGGIEYDITLNSKPAQNKIDFGIDWNNITWTKLLPLDEEYDQATCEEEWGLELAPFTITSTSITSDVTSEILLTREEYEVNSYVGMATSNNHKNSGDLGGGVTYSTVSRSYLHIHRGLMTDDLGDTVWVEDINLDESKKEITFTLPKTWLRNATYPISQVCGVDPAYTEDMDFWVTDTYGDSDSTWSDYDLFTEKGVPKGAVAEIIFAMQEPGVENWMGIRTDGSGLERRVQLHEAEGDGVTTCRMFVLCDVDTGLIEGYHSDVTDDDSFYVVGYWEHVGFTELFDTVDIGGSGWQVDTVDAGAAEKVCCIILQNNQAALPALTGVRNTSSALERKVLIHEAENGGASHVDMMVKADASNEIETSAGTASPTMYNAGYFGEELDFVELFQIIANNPGAWNAKDLTAYLDQDGRVVDFLLTHYSTTGEYYLGARDGDDSTTLRYLLEHEAEDNGTSTGELTGFGISVKTNATGKVNVYTGTTEVFYLMGYFKPGVVEPEADISNTPTSWSIGTVDTSTSYNTTVDFFEVTNNSGAAVTITIGATDFTGGNGWTLSDTATPGADTVGINATADNEDWDIIVKKTASYNTLVAGLADSATQKWGLKLYTATSHSDGVLKETTITLAATLD